MSIHQLHPPRVRAAARAAEHARWSALLAQARAVVAAVLRLPVSHPDVEDRAQDALLFFLSSGLPRFDGTRGTPEALLTTIARNCALGHLRARAVRARAGARLRDEWPAGGTDAEHRRVEAARDLDQVLARLRPAHAEALLRIDLAGERIGEAAQRLGRTYTAVNAEVGHARASARRVAQGLVAA